MRVWQTPTLSLSFALVVFARYTPPMRLLISNDDGVEAEGLRVLAEALLPLGEVTVCAPDREQSATSHSISLHRPLRIESHAPWGPRGEIQRFSVDGTPTDAVYVAVNHLLRDARPELVASGINRGANLSHDVHYSGTVAAAMEGLALGIPSIALSFAGGDLGADLSHLRQQVTVLTPLLKHLTSLPAFPKNTLLNVNLPPVPADGVKGARLTRLGSRVYSGSLKPMRDPWDRDIFWIGGGSITWTGEETSDFRAIQDGHISITPLHLDLTNHSMLESAGSWWRDQ